LTSPSLSSEESSSESSSEDEDDDDDELAFLSSSEDSLSLSEDSAFLVGAAFADAALAVFDGVTSSSEESESSSDDEEAFLEETTSETAFTALGAAFSSDDESESEESEESESESAFLGGAGVFFGEGLEAATFGAATFSGDLVGGFTSSSSLSLESDDVEGGLVAFTT